MHGGVGLYRRDHEDIKYITYNFVSVLGILPVFEPGVIETYGITIIPVPDYIILHFFALKFSAKYGSCRSHDVGT